MHCIDQDVIGQIPSFKTVKEAWSGLDSYLMTKS